MLLGLNYFPPFVASRKTCAPQSRCHMNSSKFFGAIKPSLLSRRLFFKNIYIYPSSSPSKQINHQSLTGEIEVETPRATAFKLATGQSFFFFFRLTKLLSIWEKKKKVKLYVEMHIWGDRNFKESLALIQSHSSQSLSPPSSLSSLPPFSFYLYLSHVPSIPLLLLLLLHCFCSFFSELHPCFAITHFPPSLSLSLFLYLR